MLTTTFRKLRAADACQPRYRYLAKKLGGIRQYGADTPITLIQILDLNGLSDAIWALQASDGGAKVAARFARDCADHVKHLRIDAAGMACAYADWTATNADWAAAYVADAVADAYVAGDADAAVYVAAAYASNAAANAVAFAVADADAKTVADAEWEWQEARLRELLAGG